MSQHLSPLRYPGGKSRLTPYVKAIIAQNGLLGGVYAEPYAGGASVALNLLFDSYVRKVRINDLDKGVYSFWRSVLYHTDELCTLVRRTAVTPKSWERLREVYLHPTQARQVELGFATFFLNRTNRSGIIESAGMIGGNDQRGKWKIDARYNAVELVERIQRIAARRRDITVSNLDAEDFLGRLAGDCPPDTLSYLDPPYYVKGTQRLYAAYYGTEEHEVIAGALQFAPFHWIVSYDDVQPIRKLYRDYANVRYGLRYTASERGEGSEVMFYSPTLTPPPRTPAFYEMIMGKRAA